MKIKVDWHNSEKTIILQKRELGWTWEDFDTAVDQYVALAKSVSHHVALIIDSLSAPNPPSSSVLHHYLRADSLRPKNLVIIVVVTLGGLMQNMGEVFGTTSRDVQKILQFVQSMEKAEALCNDVLTAVSSENLSNSAIE